MAAQTAVKKNRTQPGNQVSTSGMHVLTQDIIDPPDGAELLRIGSQRIKLVSNCHSAFVNDSTMGSRQGQDLANDGLQTATAQETRRHASTVRLLVWSRSSSVVPCGCLIFITDTRKDTRFGDELLLAWQALDFRLCRASLPLIFPQAFLVEGSTRCCFVLVGKSEVILPPTFPTRCRCSLKTEFSETTDSRMAPLAEAAENPTLQAVERAIRRYPPVSLQELLRWPPQSSCYRRLAHR